MPSFPPVQSVQRALALLTELNRQRVTSVGELHQRTGLPKPTIVRLLETLIAEGFSAV
jgi:IclR family mhp operon transcriptional activator